MGISQPNLVLQAAVQDALHIVGWGGTYACTQFAKGRNQFSMRFWYTKKRMRNARADTTAAIVTASEASATRPPNAHTPRPHYEEAHACGCSRAERPQNSEVRTYAPLVRVPAQVQEPAPVNDVRPARHDARLARCRARRAQRSARLHAELELCYRHRCDLPRLVHVIAHAEGVIRRLRGARTGHGDGGRCGDWGVRVCGIGARWGFV